MLAPWHLSEQWLTAHVAHIQLSGLRTIWLYLITHLQFNIHLVKLCDRCGNVCQYKYNDIKPVKSVLVKPPPPPPPYRPSCSLTKFLNISHMRHGLQLSNLLIMNSSCGSSTLLVACSVYRGARYLQCTEHFLPQH